MKKLSAIEIDELAERLQEIDAEADAIRDQLKEQIEAYGFIPPRAEKSKRVEGLAYRATVSVSSSTTVIDTEVAKIREACDESVFSVLFRTVTKYAVASGAHALLAGVLPEGAPRNLRVMFQRAVQISDRSPSLKIELKKKPAESDAHPIAATA